MEYIDENKRQPAILIVEETLANATQIKKMNRRLVSYKQIRAVEFRYEPFEKTTSKKIKRHLVK